MNTQAKIPEGALLHGAHTFPARRAGGLQRGGGLQQSRSGVGLRFQDFIGRSARRARARSFEMAKPAATPPFVHVESLSADTRELCKENSPDFGARRRTRPPSIHGPSISNRRCCCWIGCKPKGSGTWSNESLTFMVKAASGLQFEAWPMIESTLSRRRDFTRMIANHKDTTGGFTKEKRRRPYSIFCFRKATREPGTYTSIFIVRSIHRAALQTFAP